MSDTLIVMTTLPDQASARALANTLIERRLAACINILSPCRSMYRWQGSIEDSEEVPMLIKTTRARDAALQAAIRDAHPYELPEIVAVPVESGLAAYLDWVRAEVESPDTTLADTRDETASNSSD